MKKKITKLTEADLHSIVRQSFKKVLRESYDWDNMKGQQGTVGNPYPPRVKDDKPFDDVEWKFYDSFNGLAGKMAASNTIRNARKAGMALADYLRKNDPDWLQKLGLTESRLHNIVKESVKRVLNEVGDTDR